MPHPIPMIGRRFGRLTVVKELPPRGNPKPRLAYLCQCDCGGTAECLGENLRGGHSQSCGCIPSENAKAKAKDRIGQRFVKLTIIANGPNKVFPSGRSHRQVLVQCDCGVKKLMNLNLIVTERAISCGCVRKERARNRIKHGDARKRNQSTEYKSWCGMIERCENPKHHKFRIYGAREITVCKRWRDSFAAFLEDMGRKPSRRHSIDRIDVDGNYEPSNCRWATPKEQANNTRYHKRKRLGK